MDQTEQHLIGELFEKVRNAEETSGPRDREAERLINNLIARHTAAPYYLSQMVIMQEQALAAAQAQIDELEQQLAERPSGSGSFLGGLLGGGNKSSSSSGFVPSTGQRYPEEPAGMPSANYYPQQPAYQQPQQPSPGGGFLAGAMQTAAGVAGGMLLGNAIGSMFGGHHPAPAANVTGGGAAAADISSAAHQGGNAGGGAGSGSDISHVDYDGDGGMDFGFGDFDV